MLAGLDLGLEEVHLVICRHGRDLDGCLDLAEDLDEDLVDGGGATHLIHGSVQDFRGFHDGGGPIHNIDRHTQAMDGPTRRTAGATGILGTSISLLMRLIRTCILQRHTRDTGKGVN